MSRMISKKRATKPIEYPTSDGRAMAETAIHRKDFIDVLQMLEYHFRDEPNVYVSGNMMLFYEEGNKREHIAPDIFVVFGVSKKIRKYYLLWEEGKGPDIVIELTSKTTRREDMVKKRDLYRDVLKVNEYFLFDPTEDYLKPSMQGFRLSSSEYEPIKLAPDRLLSQRLNMWLERHGTDLRLRDFNTNKLLPTFQERVEQERFEKELAIRREEEQRRRADQERHRADTLAAEIERMRKLLEDQGKD